MWNYGFVLCTPPDGAFFTENILTCFRVIERTRFVKDKHTDGQTDRQTTIGETVCLPRMEES